MTADERAIHKSMLVLLKDATKWQVRDLMIAYGTSVVRLQNAASRQRRRT